MLTHAQGAGLGLVRARPLELGLHVVAQALLRVDELEVLLASAAVAHEQALAQQFLKASVDLLHGERCHPEREQLRSHHDGIAEVGAGVVGTREEAAVEGLGPL